MRRQQRCDVSADTAGGRGPGATASRPFVLREASVPCLPTVQLHHPAAAGMSSAQSVGGQTHSIAWGL
jgi:hypothetical protein